MKTVALIGNGALGLAIEIMATAQRNDIEIVVINDAEQERNKAFEPEPIIIKNYNHNLPEINLENYYEPQPSKFMNKPKNNFKRR